jgi:3-hydroxymyristoyl/3-hydroxydecanoyl-(acyl carrier protein) dehydratase
MTLPEIIEIRQDERQAAIRLALPRDAEVFRGHFPDMPVLPGVVQIDWVMRLADRCFRLHEPVASDFRVKFSRVIGPEVQLILNLNLDPAKGRLSFEYRSGEQVMSSGTVKIAMPP